LPRRLARSLHGNNGGAVARLSRAGRVPGQRRARAPGAWLTDRRENPSGRPRRSVGLGPPASSPLSKLSPREMRTVSSASHLSRPAATTIVPEPAR
jgi:hypothetical protein